MTQNAPFGPVFALPILYRVENIPGGPNDGCNRRLGPVVPLNHLPLYSSTLYSSVPEEGGNGSRRTSRTPFGGRGGG